MNRVCSGIAGAATPREGAASAGLHHAFRLPVICYLYILFCALSGSRLDSERYATG